MRNFEVPNNAPMFEYFEYAFFTRALEALVLLSVCSAVIGSYIISRRLAAICGGITHACFGGLGLGYFLGVSPVGMAALFALGSSVAVEWFTQRWLLRQDSAIAVIWAVGMAVGVLFVFLTPGYVPELNTFLFGNILTVSASDLMALGLFTVVMLLFTLWQYRNIVAVAFDRDFATVAGLPVKFVSYSMTVLVAVCIVLVIKVVGIMMLLSVLSLPIITAEVFCRRFATLVPVSGAVALVCMLGGLMVSTAVDVPCSALIVLLMAAAFVIARVAAALRGLR